MKQIAKRLDMVLDKHLLKILSGFLLLEVIFVVRLALFPHAH